MLPIFSQNNRVFAPDPPLYKQQLWVRFHDPKKGWTGWMEPGKSLLEGMNKNRFSRDITRHKIHDYVLGQILDASLEATGKVNRSGFSDQKKDSLRNSLLAQDARCQMAKRYLSDRVLQTGIKAAPDSLVYKLVLNYPETFSAKKLIDIQSDSILYVFPVMPLAPLHAKQAN